MSSWVGSIYVSHFNVNLRYCSRAIVRIGVISKGKEGEREREEGG
jgi:hypothetical protein